MDLWGFEGRNKGVGGRFCFFLNPVDTALSNDTNNAYKIVLADQIRLAADLGSLTGKSPPQFSNSTSALGFKDQIRKWIAAEEKKGNKASSNLVAVKEKFGRFETASSDRATFEGVDQDPATAGIKLPEQSGVVPEQARLGLEGVVHRILSTTAAPSEPAPAPTAPELEPPAEAAPEAPVAGGKKGGSQAMMGTLSLVDGDGGQVSADLELDGDDPTNPEKLKELLSSAIGQNRDLLGEGTFVFKDKDGKRHTADVDVDEQGEVTVSNVRAGGAVIKRMRTQSGGAEEGFQRQVARDPDIRESRMGAARQAASFENEAYLGARLTNVQNMTRSLFGGFGGGGPFVTTSSGPGGNVSFGGGGGGFPGFPGIQGFGGPQFASVGGPSFGGGFGGGTPDLLFNVGSPMMQTGNWTEDIKAESRKIAMMIQFLIQQILAGNVDAITSAMIAISRKSKNTLIMASVAMLSAMQQYDEQQQRLTDQFKELKLDPNDPNGEHAFRSKAQDLSMQMNSIAVARQMFMSQMRDVMTASEEIGNVEKSILDITGQFKRHYSRFNV